MDAWNGFYATPKFCRGLSLDPKLLLRRFVIGQAARYISAQKALGFTAEPGYQAVQRFRSSEARAVLMKLEGIPAIDEILSNPTHNNGRRLADALENTDFTPWQTSRHTPLGSASRANLYFGLVPFS